MIKYSCLTSLIAATALWAAGTAAAQQQPGGGTMGSPTQPQSQPGQPNSPTNPGMPGSTMPEAGDASNPQSFADQSFLRKTLEDSVAQQQMGQLAAQKSPSNDVKQFGEKMAQIHEQLTNQIKPVAQKLGVDEPKKPSKKDKAEIARLQSLSGADFDAAFLTDMLKDQQTDVKGFKDEEQSQDPTMQRLAKLDEPVLNQHLQILEQLAKEHNVPVETGKK
jgi:putative membrane protein